MENCGVCISGDKLVIFHGPNFLLNGLTLGVGSTRRPRVQVAPVPHCGLVAPEGNNPVYHRKKNGGSYWPRNEVKTPRVCV